jgi:hypothetical protein
MAVEWKKDETWETFVARDKAAEDALQKQLAEDTDRLHPRFHDLMKKALAAAVKLVKVGAKDEIDDAEYDAVATAAFKAEHDLDKAILNLVTHAALMHLRLYGKSMP